MKTVLAIGLLFVCSSVVEAADLEKGRASYASRCSSCHGMKGEGDGPVAQAMAPGSITNLVKGPFKYASDVEKVKELIQKGGAALQLNPMMPAAPSIEAGELSDLAAFVVSLRK